MFNLLKYKNEIPSEICNICELVTRILSFIEESNGQLDACVKYELKVILNELIINAIKHGNNCDPSKKVKTSVALTKSRHVILLVEDEGKGYNYELKCKRAQLKENFFEMNETGRGILIVSNLCDKIKFNKRGNRVIALKKL